MTWNSSKEFGYKELPQVYEVRQDFPHKDISIIGTNVILTLGEFRAFRHQIQANWIPCFTPLQNLD